MEFERNQETLIIGNIASAYKTEHIRLGTFIGGPLIAGYMLSENYKAFGDSAKAKRAWTISITVTVLVFAIIILIPEDVKIPNFLFPLVYCWVASYLTQRYQGAQLTEHINNGEKVFGWGRVVLVSLIGCAITVAALLIVLFAMGVILG